MMETFFHEGMEFALNEAGAELVRGTDDEEDVLIPSSVPYDGGSVRVVSIGPEAMSGSPVRSLRISEGIVNISEAAFMGCQCLVSAELPSSLMFIGRRAFSGCFSLTEAHLPDGLMCIGDEAFSDCISLPCADIPDSVTHIGGWAFSGCSSLRDARLPIGLDAIQDGAFSDCPMLSRADIPGTVAEIGEWAFFKCMSLGSADIPDGVRRIGSGAFSDCVSLSYINIPSALEALGGDAFYGFSFVSASGEPLEPFPGILRGKRFRLEGGTMREILPRADRFERPIAHSISDIGNDRAGRSAPAGDAGGDPNVRYQKGEQEDQND